MALEGSQPLKDTREAAADLSANQYCFVKLDTNGRVAAIAANTDVPYGVLQNKPNALGKAAEVVIIGITKILVDTGVTADEGSLIGPGVAGTVKGAARINVPGTDTTKYAVGSFRSAGAAGTVVTAVVNCASPSRAV